MLVSDGCLVRTGAAVEEGTSFEPPTPPPSSIETTGLADILEESFRRPQHNKLDPKIFHLGSVLLLMAVIRLERSVSSWWRPSLGTTSLPTTTDVTNSLVNSAAGKLKIAVNTSFPLFKKKTIPSRCTLIALQVASRHNSERAGTRAEGAKLK